MELKLKNPNDDSFYKVLNKVSEIVDELRQKDFNGLNNVFGIVELVVSDTKLKLTDADIVEEDLLTTIILLKIYE